MIEDIETFVVFLDESVIFLSEVNCDDGIDSFILKTRSKFLSGLELSVFLDISFDSFGLVGEETSMNLFYSS